MIVLARGGGSFEEMYAFNTELVARAILDSRLPVVTALGHTSDRTVADLVGDAECRTPTEAGARVVPRKADLIAHLRERGRRVDREIAQRVSREVERLGHKRQRVLQLLPAMVRQRAERIARAASELLRLSPIAQVARREEALRDRTRRVESAAAARLSNSSSALASRRAESRLERALGEVYRRHPGAGIPRAANRRALAGRRARTRLQHHAGRGDRFRAAFGEQHARRKAGQDPPRIRPDRRSRGRGRALSQDLTYEQALEKLDEQLKLLEDGNLSLEAALKAVDDARVYLKICTERLEAARKKIEVRGESEATTE